MKIPKDNLCNSCTNIGCEFQSGIVRTKCAFYIPPHIETDNCGNYVVILDKIRAELINKSNEPSYLHENEDWSVGLEMALEIIDNYKAESEE